MPNDYYVYAHFMEDEAEPFYIGKGRAKRAWARKNRNKQWQTKVRKRKYLVKILHDKLTEDAAIRFEIAYIKKYGRMDRNEGPLVNKSNGGENRSHRESP